MSVASLLALLLQSLGAAVPELCMMWAPSLVGVLEMQLDTGQKTTPNGKLLSLPINIGYGPVAC